MFDQIGLDAIARARIIFARDCPDESPFGIEKLGYSRKTRVGINESPIPALAHFDTFVHVFVSEYRVVPSLFVGRTSLAMFRQCPVTSLFERRRRYFFRVFTPSRRRSG